MTQLQSTSSVCVPTGAAIRVDRTTLEADSESARSPTVRIFVGTQMGQARAERAICWSIRQHRSPDRNYAIHWIRPLTSRGAPDALEGCAYWVPQLCGGRGRALFCTVDQILLSDPAVLFDLPMGGYPLLGPSSGDGSTLLIDCVKLAALWSVDRLRATSAPELAGQAKDLRGPLPAAWDTAADHYSVGRSKRVRYATPHTQPWRPFPDRYVYQSHPNEDLWMKCESDASQAGFDVFSRSAPSGGFKASLPCPRVEDTALKSKPAPSLSELLGAADSEIVAHDFSIRRALANLSSRRISIYAHHNADEWRGYLAAPTLNDPQLSARWGASSTQILDPGDPAAHRTDAVICANALDFVPAEDLPWVLAEVFGSATSLVHLGIRPAGRSSGFRARPGDPVRRTLSWWLGQIEAVAARHPRVHWQAVYCRGEATEIRHGGRRIGNEAPTVWVLTDDRPGNTSQSTGLAEALGWPYTVKNLHFSPASRLHNRLLGASRVSINRRRSSPLAPPWPDLVITAGRRSAPAAQWIRARNFGQTHLVQLGRKGGDAADQFDLVVTPSYGQLDPHPRRLVTSAPLHNISAERIRQATRRFQDRLPKARRPRIVVLVGGWSGQYRLDAKTARKLGQDVVRLAEEVGGSIFATTSRRAGNRGSEAFCAALSNPAHVHRWSASDSEENPYLAFLGLADAFVTTGDSESMLSEAASLGRPLYIYTLPERASYHWMRIGRDWVYARAHARHRGLATQRGLEYWCARLIDLGFVRPTRDLRYLHQGLIREGVARHFGDSFDTQHGKALGDEERVVERVGRLLGFGANP
jgi:mitochondrial fission protein ELM1